MNNFENDNNFFGNENNEEPILSSPESVDKSIDNEEAVSFESSDKEAPSRVYGTYTPISEDASSAQGDDGMASAFDGGAYGGFSGQESNSDSSDYSDSYYMNKSPYGPRFSEEFGQPKSSGKKKKKYISVSAAVIALVLTAAVSIAGGAALSNTSLFGGKSAVVPNGTSLTDNIDKSMGIKTPDTISGAQTIANQGGQVLTTPEIVDKVGPAVVGIINNT